MITPSFWATIVANRLSLRTANLTDNQLDAIKDILNEQHWTDARLTFAVNRMLVCLDEAHHYLDVLRHLLAHGAAYVDPNRPKCKPRDTETERVEQHSFILSCLRRANDMAISLGLPTINEPAEWLTLTDQIAPTEDDVRAALKDLDCSMSRRLQPSARLTWRGIKAALVRGQSKESVLARLRQYHSDADAVVEEIEKEIAAEAAHKEVP